MFRTEEELGNAVAPLLRMSNRILFVDKLFEPATERWQRTLCKFIEIALEGRNQSPTFEIHTIVDPDEYMLDEEERENEYHQYCDQNLAPLLPQSVDLSILKWDDKPEGAGMHARLVLTERGGMHIDWGLDTGTRTGQKTLVKLLSESTWRDLMNMYNEPSNEFDLVYSIRITGRI